MKNYEEIVERLRTSVDKCSSEVSTIMQYFLTEANSYSEGIPTEVAREVNNLSSRFFSKCTCMKAEEKEDSSVYKGSSYGKRKGGSSYGRCKGPYTN